MLELVTGSHPWRELTGGDKSLPPHMILKKIAEATEPPQLPPSLVVPAEFRDFLACCLQLDPAKRHGADELLLHTFLTLDNSFAFEHAVDGAGEVQSNASVANVHSFAYRRSRERVAASELALDATSPPRNGMPRFGGDADPSAIPRASTPPNPLSPLMETAMTEGNTFSTGATPESSRTSRPASSAAARHNF